MTFWRIILILLVVSFPLAPLWGWTVGEFGRYNDFHPVVGLTIVILPWWTLGVASLIKLGMEKDF